MRFWLGYLKRICKIMLKLHWIANRKLVYMYAECWVESQLDPLQAVCNNLCIVLKWVYYWINQNDNTTITDHSIQKQRITAKELSMDPFKCQCKCTSLYWQLLFVYIKNKPQWEWMSLVCTYTCILLSGMLGNFKYVGYLLANGTRSIRFHIHFYTNAHDLISFMMFYDVKPQLVKSCCRGYPKQNITKSHMPMLITNTKLQYKPESCFHCTLSLTLLQLVHQSLFTIKYLLAMLAKPNMFPNCFVLLDHLQLLQCMCCITYYNHFSYMCNIIKLIIFMGFNFYFLQMYICKFKKIRWSVDYCMVCTW